MVLQTLESFIFYTLVIPLDWVGIVTRITDPKEYQTQYQLNSYLQMILYQICEFLNELDYESIKLYTLAVICPPLALFWKFGCSIRVFISVLGMMLGLTPLVLIYTIYCIKYDPLDTRF